MEMVPSSALQVDIFVTNPTEIKNNRHSLLSDTIHGGRDEFAPPTARFMGRQRSGSNSSADSITSAQYSAANSMIDLSYLQSAGESGTFGRDRYLGGELGHEGHILDYTNFDGEVDTRAPGEANISKNLQKEGKIRRARSRRVTVAQTAKAELESRSKQGAYTPMSPTTTVTQPMLDTHGERDPFKSNMPSREGGLPQGAYSPITRRLSQPPPSSFDPRYAVSAADQYRSNDAYPWLTDPASQNRWSPPSNQQAYRPPSPVSKSTDDFHLSVGDLHRGITPSPAPGGDSIHQLMNDRPESRQSDTGEHEPRLEISEQELEDISFVSEMARPGKPKIERVLADEVGRSRGAVAVACEC